MNDQPRHAAAPGGGQRGRRGATRTEGGGV